MRTQNPLVATPCGFKSHRRHHVGMDYAPFKKPSRLAGLFSYRSVIPPSPHKTLRCKLSWGPRSTGQEGSGHQFHHANLQQSKGKALLRYFCATMHPVARVHPSVCSALSSSKQRGTAKGIPLLFPSFAAHRILDPAQKPLTAQLVGALCSDNSDRQLTAAEKPHNQAIFRHRIPRFRSSLTTI